jgi:predicted nucleic acid-binding protein
MNNLGINSVMLDTSFCIRLMDKNDSLHQNALSYFKYFLAAKITIHVSTIVIAEYAVGDDPTNLPLSNLQIEAFDFMDGKMAGIFHKQIKGDKENVHGFNRRIIANDVKILAQIHNKKVEGIISKDISSIKQFVNPLITSNLLQVKFFDLNTPLNEALGQLFT